MFLSIFWTSLTSWGLRRKIMQPQWNLWTLATTFWISWGKAKSASHREGPWSLQLHAEVSHWKDLTHLWNRRFINIGRRSWVLNKQTLHSCLKGLVFFIFIDIHYTMLQGGIIWNWSMNKSCRLWISDYIIVV